MIHRKSFHRPAFLRAPLLRPIALAGVSWLALSSGAVFAADNNGELQEVVVTAQLRKQAAQDVPIAMQVVGAEQIEALAADSIADMQAFVPGLQVSGSSTQPHYSLRGIKSNDFGVGTDPAIGIYVDGVYSARSGSALLEFNDVDQIAVLKGPQGTLFGRNSAAGAISIVTNKPVNKFAGDISQRIGSDGEYKTEAMLNLPLTDKLAMRTNVVWHRSDGWAKDAATGRDLAAHEDFASKVAFRYTPDADSSVQLTFTHDNLNGRPRVAIDIAPVSVVTNKASPYFGLPLPAFPVNAGALLNPQTQPITAESVNQHEERHLDDITLTAQRAFGDWVVTTIGNYRQFNTDDYYGETGSNLPYLNLQTDNKEKNRQHYHELRVNYANQLLDLVAGGSYYQEHTSQVTNVIGTTTALDLAAYNGTGTAPFGTIDQLLSAAFKTKISAFEGQNWMEQMVNNGGDNSAYAGFSDIIWHAMDRLDVTTGLRFTHDEKHYSWQVPNRVSAGIDQAIAGYGGTAALGQTLTTILIGAGYPPAMAQGLAGQLVGATTNNFAYRNQSAGGRAFAAANSWTNFSPRIVADYKLTHDIHAYVSYTEGYKAGGFNSQQPPVATSGSALAAAAKFSPEKVQNYEGGVKAEFPEQRLHVNASVYHYAYNNRQNVALVQPCSGCIEEFVTQTEDDQATGADLDLGWSPLRSLQLTANAGLIDATVAKPGATLPGQVPVLSGKPTGEPFLSLAFTATYTWLLQDGSSLMLNAAHAYRGEGRCNNNVPSLTNISSCNGAVAARTTAAQNTTDLQLSWDSESDRYRVGAFVKNLLNNRWTTTLGGNGVGVFGTVLAEISEPRRYGIDMSLKF